LGSYRSGETLPGAAQPLAELAHSPENLILELARQYGDIQIELDHTSPAEARAFVDAILDLEPNRLEEAFRKDLYLQTRGQALFTVETLHSLRQNQNIMQDEAGYWVENKASTPAPRSPRVEAIIEQRLRRLEPLQRELLEVASVEGEGFSAEIVANVLGLDFASALKFFTHDLGQQHPMIQEQGQLHVRSISLNRFQFRHMLIQATLYDQLNPAEKRRLHRRLAEELEKTLSGPEDLRSSAPGRTPKSGEIIQAGILDEKSDETLDTFGPALLRHFWLGQEWARAAEYARKLGERARQRYAMREAIAYFEQALESLGNQAGSPDEMIFDVLLDWEEAAFNFRPYADQLEQLARAEKIARDLQDKARLIQALHWTANVLLARGRWAKAGPLLAESFSLAEELGNEQLAVRPTFFKALMTSFADPAEALLWIDRAEDLSRKHNDLQIEANAYGMEGYVLAQLGEFERSERAIDHSRQVSDRLGSPLIESDVDLFAAWAGLAMGKPEQALEFAQRSVQRAIETDNTDCICSGMVCLGYAQLELGRPAEAASAFEKGIERSEVSGAFIHWQNGQAGLAMTQFMAGHAEAIQGLEKVIADMRLSENQVGAANANLMLGACLTRMGEAEPAKNALTQAVDFYRRARMQPSLARALQSMADLMAAQGRAAEANAYRQEAQALHSPAIPGEPDHERSTMDNG
jgi:tetratricopeptide (TPR) repeat protein